MVLAGVKTHGVRQEMPKHQRRRRTKALAKRNESRTRAEAPIEDLIASPPLVATTAVADPATGVAPPIDWSRPFG